MLIDDSFHSGRICSAFGSSSLWISGLSGSSDGRNRVGTVMPKDADFNHNIEKTWEESLWASQFSGLSSISSSHFLRLHRTPPQLFWTWNCFCLHDICHVFGSSFVRLFLRRLIWVLVVNPFPLLLPPPHHIRKTIGSISNFGKFVVDQFDFSLIPSKKKLKTKLLFVGFPPKN